MGIPNINTLAAGNVYPGDTDHDMAPLSSDEALRFQDIATRIGASSLEAAVLSHHPDASAPEPTSSDGFQSVL